MKCMNHAAHAMGESMTTATAKSGGKLMSKLTRHPVVMVGLGLAAGYVVYKYRKEIISGVSHAGNASKDFVLQQKENLEDIVAEAKEEKN